MAAKRKSPVEKYHDRVAARYDDTYDDAYWRWHDALTWDHLKTLLPADQSRPCLDLGCGTGKWGLRLLKSGFRVTFVDVSMAMLEAARRQVEGVDGFSRAEFHKCDLCDLDGLPRDAFALAVAFGEPIGCARDPGRALKGIRRLLRTDGVLVATLDNRLACVDYYLEKADIGALDRFVRDGRTNWLTKDAQERFEIHTYAPRQVERLLSGCGFELVDMIGKTVLPMRHHRAMLESPDARRRLIKLEKRLWRDPAAIGRAAHLQFAAKPK